MKTTNVTSRQLWQAAEHHVIAQLGFQNIPATKMPDNWPDYDLIAQRLTDERPLRNSVKWADYKDKSAHYIGYEPHAHFDFSRP
jgi:hypothetical protein